MRSTFLVVLASFAFFAPPAPSQENGADAAAAIEAGLGWLARHQDPAGKWDSDGFSTSCKGEACSGPGADWCDPGQTGLALLAFLGAGHVPGKGTHAEAVSRAIGYLRGIQDAEGCFGPRENQYMYNHAIATLAICEAYGETKQKDLMVPAQKGIEFLLAAQNPGKAWRYQIKPGDNDTSVTAWALLALVSARTVGIEVPAGAFEGAREWLDAATDEATGRTGYIVKGDTGARLREEIGIFAPSETCTAISIWARSFLSLDREGPLAGRQVELLLASLPCHDPTGGPGGTSTIDSYYWYHGSFAALRTGGETWKTWDAALVTAIVPHQSDKGDALGSWDPIGAWKGVGGRVTATALNLLSLEIHSRAEKAHAHEREK
ncbi:MAG: terpene cyclase/mutase family protein [Planctomycetes bacterium]|nr:terpene cyclase/mutase family protein [Planctomycetota bacterium]